MLTTETMPPVVTALIEAGVTPYIKGPPGVGKSDMVRQLVADMSKDLNRPVGLVTAIVSGLDPADARGFLIPMKGDGGQPPLVRATMPPSWPNKFNVEVYLDGVKADHYDGALPANGVFFLDEFSQADVDLQKVFAQVILERRLGEHALPEGWHIICAGNRVEDRAGVCKTLSHLQNRVAELHLTASYPAWETWAVRNGIHPLVISFAKAHAGDVFVDAVPKNPGPFCTPRSLVMAERALRALDPSHSETTLPDNEAAMEIVSGLVGEGVMPKLISHIRLGNDLPDVEDVINDPVETKVPDRIDARFVMTTALAVHATSKPEAAKPIFRYIRRVDKELQILFVQTTLKRDPGILSTAEFSEWVMANNDLILAATAG